MIKAVVFDLDDTLYSERDYVSSGFYAVGKALGQNAQDANKIAAQLESLFNMSKTGVFDRYAAMCAKGNVSAEQMTQLYRTHSPVIQPFPDVIPCLKALKSAGIKTGIITDGTPSRQRAKIAALNIGNYFDCVIVTDELGGVQFRKPCLTAFEQMQKHLNVALKETAYVGDNPEKDFYVGQSNVFTVRIERKIKIHATENYYKGITERMRIQSLDKLTQYCEWGGNSKCP